MIAWYSRARSSFKSSISCSRVTPRASAGLEPSPAGIGARVSCFPAMMSSGREKVPLEKLAKTRPFSARFRYGVCTFVWRIGCPGGGEDESEPWYKDAVIYEVDVKTYQDTGGDSVGDFQGLSRRLAHIQGLGATCIWLQPFYPSPGRDDGY